MDSVQKNSLVMYAAKVLILFASYLAIKAETQDLYRITAPSSISWVKFRQRIEHDNDPKFKQELSNDEGNAENYDLLTSHVVNRYLVNDHVTPTYELAEDAATNDTNANNTSQEGQKEYFSQQQTSR